MQGLPAETAEAAVQELFGHGIVSPSALALAAPEDATGLHQTHDRGLLTPEDAFLWYSTSFLVPCCFVQLYLVFDTCLPGCYHAEHVSMLFSLVCKGVLPRAQYTPCAPQLYLDECA